MKDLIEIITELAITATLGFGAKEVHNFVKEETLKTVSKGLSSSEELANALTGEATGF